MVARDKPSVAALGIDVERQQWRRSGPQDGAVEVAFTTALGELWVLMRVSGDPEGRILVYDRHEWECFLDGAKQGEFDDIGTDPTPAGPAVGTTGGPVGSVTGDPTGDPAAGSGD